MALLCLIILNYAKNYPTKLQIYRKFYRHLAFECNGMKQRLEREYFDFDMIRFHLCGYVFGLNYFNNINHL